jgi:geranylgeranyl reductase family protein
MSAVPVLRADALVIGAGPAGSAAARTLAREGRRVVLADRHGFPRDKVCGDALIPDALVALAGLGVRDAVLARARTLERLRVYAPDHSYLTLEGTCACVPRLVLDDLLRDAAVAAGAEFLPGLRAAAPIERGGAVAGAELEDARTRERVRIDAPVTVLATGAASDALARFGMCGRSAPSATAARIYVQVEDDAAAAFDHLCIAYSASICPGYGWIFPGPDGVFNVGVGYFYDAPRLPPEKNVRRLLASFLDGFPPAVELMRHGRAIRRLQGAPLRTAMEGARFARPGLFVVGEAAGLTYSFSGEGIGKALQSGVMAANAVARHGTSPDGLRAAADDYTTALVSGFEQRFKAYKKMQRWLAWPAFANFLTRRANAGTFVRSQLQALFDDTGTPDGLLSVTGLVRAILS